VSDPEYLTLEDALGIIEVLAVGRVRDLGLLDSALARPRASAFGLDAYETLALKASSLLQSLVNNHPLVDGNKRLAWLCTVVFLRLNNHKTELNDDDALELVWDIASATLELDEICLRLRVEVDPT